MRPDDPDFIYLVSKLKKYDIILAGQTVDHWKNRGEGILKYLIEHSDIDDYVIPDDNTFDFMDYIQDFS